MFFFTVTQRQYDTAKEVILDILGYGVPPEYLIDCGLSREIIYYVFTELSLRLPNNLDVVGIPPYPPPPDVMASILLSQPSYSLPSASLDNSNVPDDAGARRSSEHRAFSPRPPASHGMFIPPSFPLSNMLNFPYTQIRAVPHRRWRQLLRKVQLLLHYSPSANQP